MGSGHDSRAALLLAGDRDGTSERYISASKDTFLSASEADEYSIASAVGSDYAEWVNAKYL